MGVTPRDSLGALASRRSARNAVAVRHCQYPISRDNKGIDRTALQAREPHGMVVAGAHSMTECIRCSVITETSMVRRSARASGQRPVADSASRKDARTWSWKLALQPLCTLVYVTRRALTRALFYPLTLTRNGMRTQKGPRRAPFQGADARRARRGESYLRACDTASRPGRGDLTCRTSSALGSTPKPPRPTARRP